MPQQSPSLRDPDTIGQLVERILDGVYLTDRDGAVVDANPTFLEMFGYGSVEELRGTTTGELVVDRDAWLRERELLRRDGAVRDFELQIRRADGTLRTVIDSGVLIVDPDTGAELNCGVLVDVTRWKELEQQLRDLAIRDPLTGCFNRRYLAELEVELEHRCRSWGAIVVDIDRFKAYNDLYGHQAGDDILVRIGRFLSSQVRPQDTVIRLGGDEFLLLLPDADRATTEGVAERLRRHGPDAAPVSFTLGWAAREVEERPERTIGRADRRLILIRVDARRWRRRDPDRSR